MVSHPKPNVKMLHFNLEVRHLNYALVTHCTSEWNHETCRVFGPPRYLYQTSAAYDFIMMLLQGTSNGISLSSDNIWERKQTPCYLMNQHILTQISFLFYIFHVVIVSYHTVAFHWTKEWTVWLYKWSATLVEY